MRKAQEQTSASTTDRRLAEGLKTARRALLDAIDEASEAQSRVEQASASLQLLWKQYQRALGKPQSEGWIGAWGDDEEPIVRKPTPEEIAAAQAQRR